MKTSHGGGWFNMLDEEKKKTAHIAIPAFKGVQSFYQYYFIGFWMKLLPLTVHWLLAVAVNLYRHGYRFCGRRLVAGSAVGSGIQEVCNYPSPCSLPHSLSPLASLTSLLEVVKDHGKYRERVHCVRCCECVLSGSSVCVCVCARKCVQAFRLP